MQLTLGESERDRTHHGMHQWLVANPLLIRSMGTLSQERLHLPLGIYWVESGSGHLVIKGGYVFSHPLTPSHSENNQDGIFFCRFDSFLEKIFSDLGQDVLWVDSSIPSCYLAGMEAARYRLATPRMILDPADFKQIRANHHYLEMSLVYGLGALEMGASTSEIRGEMFDYLSCRVGQFSSDELKIRMLDQENKETDVLTEKPVRIFFNQLLHWKSLPVSYNRVVGWGEIALEWKKRYQRALENLHQIHRLLRSGELEVSKELAQGYQLSYFDPGQLDPTCSFNWREVGKLNLKNDQHRYLCLRLVEEEMAEDGLEFISTVIVEDGKVEVLQASDRWLNFHW